MAKNIVMIHGMMGAGWHWDNYAGFFRSKGYNCITPTLRYHDMHPQDQPDPRLGSTSLLDYAHDLEQQIKQLDEPPIVMGHSMGGLLAQMMGSRGLAQAVVALTPAPPHGIMTLKLSVMKLFFPAVARWGFWRKPFRSTFKQSVDGFMHLMTLEEQKAVYDKSVYESGLVLKEIGLWFLDTRKASQVDYQKVQCPVLIIGGKHDQATPAAVVKQNAAKYQGKATYIEYPDHAHWVLGEPGWEKIVQDIYNWLQKQPHHS